MSVERDGHLFEYDPTDCQIAQVTLDGKRAEFTLDTASCPANHKLWRWLYPIRAASVVVETINSGLNFFPHFPCIDHTANMSRRPAIVIYTRFKQGGQQFFQAQCVAQGPGNKLLVLTLTNGMAFDDALIARWKAMLAGFVPATAQPAV